MPEKSFHITSSKIYNFVYDGTNWVFVGDCNTDKYVQQNTVSYNDDRPLLLSYSQRSDTNQNIEALGTAYMTNSIYANAATGTVSATNFNGKINNHTVNADVPSNAVFTDTTYTFGAGLSTSATNVDLSLVSTTPTTNEANVTNHVYPVEVDKNGKLAVLVPWVNTNSTYTSGDGLVLNSSEFSHYYPNLTTDAEGTYTPTAEDANSLKDITVDAFGHIVGVNYSNKSGIYYLTGGANDAKGVWTATEPEITAYYDGLTILYVPTIAGGSSSTTLDINGLGPIGCYTTNTTNMTTNYAVGTPILLTYVNGKWRRADYNSNTTYSAMSAAEQAGGTATSARTITAAVLRNALVGYADTAGYASQAEEAIYASSAGYAVTASNALSALTAVTAGWAVTAGNAIKAHSASFAITAGQAITASNAVKAHCAAYAVTAGNAVYANCANYATTAGQALNSVNAVNATKATQDGSGNVITSTYATKTELNSLIAANDAMVYKGTLGTTNGAIKAVPTNGYLIGWTYKIVDAGTYAGFVCEPGDLLIAISDGPETGTTVTNGHWTVAQTNIDGAVTTTLTSSTSGSLAIFTGTSGKTIAQVPTVGTSTKPIYIDSNGRPQTITSYEGMAGSATFATTAGRAVSAASAGYAMTASGAVTAGRALSAASASFASSAQYAANAALATTANWAVTAGRAVSAASSTYAAVAGKISDLTTSDKASSTTNQRYVWFAYSDNKTGRPAYDDTFTYQTSTQTLTVANVNGVATTAVEANHAGSADSATTAGQAIHAASANYAVNSASASYATTSGRAVSAASAGFALSSSSAGYAASAAQATHSASAGFATTAGRTVYAASAGYSTSAAQATHAASANFAMISSANSTAKLFMLGTTAQAASSMIPYTNSAVYATNGAFAATNYKVAEKVILQYNTSTDALDFVFV